MADNEWEEIDELGGLLASIYLYVPWQFVTKQLTTEQKELWADAIDAHWQRVNGAEPGLDPKPVDRWWRE